MNRWVLQEELSYFIWGLRLLFLDLRAVREDEEQRLSYGDDPSQYLLCFFPERPAKKPFVFFVHGGGWIAGSPAELRAIGRYFSRQGYIAVMPGYRHAPKHRHPAPVEDVFAAFSCCQRLLSKRAIVVGSSVGAQLGALLVFDRERQAKYGLSSERFAGFASLGGPLDFGACHTPVMRVMLEELLEGKGECDADPICHVPGNSGIPVLCLHGARDPIVEPENSRAFVAKLRASGQPAELEILPRMHHFDLVVGSFLRETDATRILLDWMRRVG